VIALHDVSEWATRNRLPDRWQPRDVAVGAIPLVLLLVLLVWPGSQTQWLANRATLAQTREELSSYVMEMSPSQDELRRNGSVDLDEAMALYRQTLQNAPNNTTALRRLAQIQIARGDYDAALLNLERAHQVAPGERATRQMLGELYAREGRIDEAAALWRTITVAPELLRNRLWWYNFIGDLQAAENISTVLQRLGR
jgi:predicted Zn-dependent protease